MGLKMKLVFWIFNLCAVYAQNGMHEMVTVYAQNGMHEMVTAVNTSSSIAGDTTTAPNTTSAVTTANPVTTTATPVTTTALPSNPTVIHFNVSNGGNSSCILASMGTRFLFTTSSDQQIVDLTVVSNVSGTCNDAVQTMDITFLQEGQDWHLSLNFINSSGRFSLTQVKLEYKSNGNSVVYAANTTDVSAPLKSSYQCNSGINVTKFQPEAQPDKLALTSTFFYKFQVEAFRLPGSENKFSTPHSCEADAAVNQLVPIIVGAALALLVIIVLIAYLVGRARNRRAGYESV